MPNDQAIEERQKAFARTSHELAEARLALVKADADIRAFALGVEINVQGLISSVNSALDQLAHKFQAEKT